MLVEKSFCARSEQLSMVTGPGVQQLAVLQVRCRTTRVQQGSGHPRLGKGFATQAAPAQEAVFRQWREDFGSSFGIHGSPLQNWSGGPKKPDKSRAIDNCVICCRPKLAILIWLGALSSAIFVLIHMFEGLQSSRSQFNHVQQRQNRLVSEKLIFPTTSRYSIIRNGLQILSNTELMRSGARFGTG